MSGIEGCYYEDDWGWKWTPGKIFSNPDTEDPEEVGYYLEKPPDQVERERRHWQNVSSCLQHNKRLAPYQARLKIYELEKKVHDQRIKKDFLKESPNNIVRIIYGECDV